MKVLCRDLGTMDYASCWELQRSLFEELAAEKRGRTRELSEGPSEELEKRLGEEPGAKQPGRSCWSNIRLSTPSARAAMQRTCWSTGRP